MSLDSSTHLESVVFSWTPSSGRVWHDWGLSLPGQFRYAPKIQLFGAFPNKPTPLFIHSLKYYVGVAGCKQEHK